MRSALKLLTLPTPSNISAQTLIAGLKMSCEGLTYLVGLIGIFKKYASKDKDADNLNKSELKELLQNEFPVLLSDNPKPDEVDRIMADLDNDGNGQVDIQEYFVTLCALGVIIYDLVKESHCPNK